MSRTKPAIADVRFAVDGSDADASNIAAPTSGLRDTGYPTNAIPTSGTANYFRNRNYRWFQFLDEVFKAGGTAIADFAIGGNATIGGAAVAFASHTFTANSTTDELTVTAHGLQTGDGVLQTSNSGGALPAGLVAATDYYAIVTGANTFKVATTRTNALAGVAINLTTTGSGTNSIVGVSATRAGAANVTGDLDAGRVLPLVNATWPVQAAAWIQETGSGLYTSGVGFGQWNVAAGASARLIAPLVLPVGTVLSKIRFSYSLGGAGNSVTVSIGSLTVANGANLEVNLALDNSSTSWHTLDTTNFGVDVNGDLNASAGPHVTRADRFYWLAVNLTRATGTFQFAGAMVNP